MLQVALDKLAQSGINKDAQRAIANTLKAAANPHHGKADVIVKSLPKERQRMIHKTMAGVKKISDAIMTRGKKGLLDMAQDEWDALVNEQAN
jgi:hypothetical protein